MNDRKLSECRSTCRWYDAVDHLCFESKEIFGLVCTESDDVCSEWEAAENE